MDLFCSRQDIASQDAAPSEAPQDPVMLKVSCAILTVIMSHANKQHLLMIIVTLFWLHINTLLFMLFVSAAQCAHSM